MPLFSHQGRRERDVVTDRPLEFHPHADLFPLLEGDELQALADDIKEHGQRQPIVMHEGKILDGRNRYLACRMAETEPEFVDYDGTDALGFVVSLNWRRRHLSASQRAFVAAQIANMRQELLPPISLDMRAVAFLPV